MKKIILMVSVLSTILFAEDSIPTVDKPIMDERMNIYRTALLSEQGKTECSVFGSVIDQSTREPIGKVKILVLGTKFSAVSGSDGRFILTVDGEGYFQLKMEAEGYESQIINNVYFKDGSPAGFFKLNKINQRPPDFVEVDKQPVPIQGSTAAPGYPEQAKKERIEGTAWVKVWVDEKGSPRKVEIVKSDAEIFNQPSIDAAMKWKFEPAVLKGKPVAVWVTIPFKFKLDPNMIPSEILDKQPKPQKTVAPKYPESAKKFNLTGTFFLAVLIDEEGAVAEASIDRYDMTDNKESTVPNLSLDEKKKRADEVNSSIEEMKASALLAIKQWKFSAAIKEGKAVKAKVTIPVKYSLNDSKEEKKK